MLFGHLWGVHKLNNVKVKGVVKGAMVSLWYVDEIKPVIEVTGFVGF